eukprot:gene4834-6024_t
MKLQLSLILIISLTINLVYSQIDPTIGRCIITTATCARTCSGKDSDGFVMCPSITECFNYLTENTQFKTYDIQLKFGYFSGHRDCIGERIYDFSTNGPKPTNISITKLMDDPHSTPDELPVIEGCDQTKPFANFQFRNTEEPIYVSINKLNIIGADTQTEPDFNAPSTGVTVLNTRGDFSSTLKVTDSKFERLYGSFGGAVSTNRLTLRVSGSTFTGCVARQGGAVFSGFRAESNNNNYESNMALENGGAIHTNYGSMISDTFTSNKITGSDGNDVIGEGGAVYASVISSIQDSFFTNNTAQHGGAVYISDAIYNVTGSGFFENIAQNGGAIFIQNIQTSNSPISFDQTTFKSNVATNSSGALDYQIENGNIIGGSFIDNVDSNQDPNSPRAFRPSTYTVNVNSESDCQKLSIIKEEGYPHIRCSSPKGTSKCYNGLAIIDPDLTLYHCNCFDGYQGFDCSVKS